MGTNEGDCRVVVVGAGAGGTLVATHLVTALSSRFRVELVDPVATTGRGQAYSTTDERHLLNVPASGMSAFPRDPEHFLRWLRNHHDPKFQPHDFAPRAVFGRYLESLLTTATEFPGNARLVRRRAEVVDITASGSGFVVDLSDGERLEARAVVLATSSRPGTGWAPAELAADARLVADPWTQAIPEVGDVLMLGSGLTMVDLAISADRPDRTVHVVSRTDAVPQPHVLPTTPPVPPPPGITRTQGLDALRSTLAAHVDATVEATGDWRAAIDGLRPVTAQLWRGLSDADKRRFIAEDARSWDVHRHRMAPGHRTPLRRRRGRGPPAPAPRHHRRRAPRRARAPRHPRRRHDAARRRGGQLHRAVGSIAADPLLTRLAQTGLVRPGPAGLGIDTTDDGRILGTLPDSVPFLAVGSLRTRQPVGVHGDARDPRAGLRRRPRGQPLDARRVPPSPGRPLRPHPLDQLRRRRALQPRPRSPAAPPGRRRGGPRRRGRRRRGLRPGTRRARAARPRVGHQHPLGRPRCAPPTGPPPSATSTTARARSSTRSPPGSAPTRPPARAALLRHVRLFPRDALAVSVAVPDGRVRRSHQRLADRPAGRVARPVLRRRLVVRRPARVRPPGPGALGRGGGAVVLRPVRRARVRPRRPRPRPRLLRDRRPHGRTGLARRVDPHPRSRGQPPLALLLARRAPRADAGRRRGRTPPLPPRARTRRSSAGAASSSTAARCCGAAASPAPGPRTCRSARSARRPRPSG